jgi:hypothetical protein
MYRKNEQPATAPTNFELPFEGKLDVQNRWVIMAELIPWAEFEAKYASLFAEEIGAPAKSFRMALGALIIKEKLGSSDRETVEQIKENPYLQYFIGFLTYSNKAPFEASMLVHFGERIGLELINKINRQMVKNQRESQGEKSAIALFLRKMGSKLQATIIDFLFAKFTKYYSEISDRKINSIL